MLTEEKICNGYKLNIKYSDSYFSFFRYFMFFKRKPYFFGVREKNSFYIKKKSYSVVEQLKINGLHISQLINPSCPLFFMSLIVPHGF